MNELQTKRCLPCEGGVPALTASEVSTLQNQVKNWQLSENSKFISQRFNFKNFYKTMAFVNAVAWIANQENHHPDLEVGFNYCVVKYTTHAANGLTQNDFICAAKVDALGVQTA